MLHLADKAINELAMSKYAELNREDSPSIVLCHQDFGKGNALDAPDGIYVLDLDGVTFDLPARDLRKIIGKNAENRGQWQTGAIRDIIDCYCEVNPLGFTFYSRIGFSALLKTCSKTENLLKRRKLKEWQNSKYQKYLLSVH